ncbi:MAG: riboflavin kinase [Phycisphaerales bacterium]
MTSPEHHGQHGEDRGGVALTIGNFDGVHLGHRALIERCRARVGSKGKVIALAFYPHPMVKLSPEHAPEPIEAFAQRADRLLRLGVDRVVELSPTPELLGKSPQAFVDELIDAYEPRVIVEGHDFHFGKRRAGTPVVLRELAGLRRGCRDRPPGGGGADGPVGGHRVVDDHALAAGQRAVRMRSVRARARTSWWGRSCRVISWDGPSASVRPMSRRISMLPRDGVYAAVVTLPDGTRVGGAVNVGARPTVQGTHRRAEVHLIDRDGAPLAMPEGTSEYGWAIRVGLIAWVRDQVRFDSVEMLGGQLSRDVKRVAAMVEPLLGSAYAVESL